MPTRPPIMVVLAVLAAVSPLAAQKLVDLADTPVTKRQEALLGRLVAVPAPGQFDVANQLATKPSRPLVERLTSLSRGEKAEQRIRAALVLGKIPARSALERVVSLAVGDTDESVRVAAVGMLLADGVAGLVKEAGLADSMHGGLEDSSLDVRFGVALVLARTGDEAAAPVLKKGLKDRDHHRREEAAEALALLGDASGVGVLIKMIRYTDRTHPALKANRELEGTEAWKRLVASVHEERIRVCGHLARLKAKRALSALKKLVRAKDARVAAAAKKAVAAISAE